MPRPLVLCIDDEEMGLRIRSTVLEHAGYRVMVAADGPTGLSIFANEPVDAVVLDYYMPVMNGGTVATEMRRLRPDVPILLLSAYINLPPEVIRIVDFTILKGDGPGILLAKLQDVLRIQPDSIDQGDLG